LVSILRPTNGKVSVTKLGTPIRISSQMLMDVIENLFPLSTSFLILKGQTVQTADEKLFQGFLTLRECGEILDLSLN
jgi:hypothetical protein